jgi:hypothetical protein
MKRIGDSLDGFEIGDRPCALLALCAGSVIALPSQRGEGLMALVQATSIIGKR